MKISVLGAGNGGQAIAAHLAIMGHEVSLFDIKKEKIEVLKRRGNIELCGALCGCGIIRCFTTDIELAIKGAEIIMVTTIANAHEEIAQIISPYLEDNQIVILNPGRTCGALVFKKMLKETGCTKKIYLGEAQTLIYACRIINDGEVNVIGVKDKVLLSAFPSVDTEFILNKLHPIFKCFIKAKNILQTGLENIGAMFHPCVLLFNAATIERKETFWFYRDMTEQIANFIERFDAERVAVGKAFGIDLLGVNEWIKFAYSNTAGNTLCERMRNNPAYHDIKAPSSIFSRQLIEDIPTGVIPIMELGKIVNVATPLLESMVNLCVALLGIDFFKNGRTLSNLGLEGLSKNEVIDYITNGNC